MPLLSTHRCPKCKGAIYRVGANKDGFHSWKHVFEGAFWRCRNCGYAEDGKRVYGIEVIPK